MKTRAIGVATLLLLPIFFSFVSFATADNVTITIKGGVGCTATIQNHENHTIIGYISIVSHRIFSEGGTNTTAREPIDQKYSVSIRSLPPDIQSIYAIAQAENQTVIQEGISIFHFVILFR